MSGQDLDVAAWLRDLGLERYAQAFRDAEITSTALLELTDADLRELGLPLGPRKVVLRAIRELAGPPATSPAAAGLRLRPVPSEAERRQLTVMFVDLVGSTALSARLDPEEMREILRSYQDLVAGAVARFGGHVAKLMGDGVLAYFGWPQAHEDEAERAVRAGLRIAEMAPKVAAPAGEPPLATRIGIASGLVVVGDLVGQGGAQEEAVVGETPNLAARLQEVAGSGTVVVAQGTRRLIGQVFELQALGPIRLKGFGQPVPCYRVLGERPAESRFEAHHSGSLLPMVGRDQELALLLERWRQAAAGEGQAVLLVGEAGIGKSRLVQATLDAIKGEEPTALRYQCSPHHTGTALWPVIQQIGFAAGLAPGDSEAARLGKLEALLRQGVEDTRATVPLLAALLGITAGARDPTLELTPQQRRVRTLSALVEQLLGLARRRPVLTVLEDAHWIDPTTLELIGQTLDRIAGARVLMLLTTRPDNQPALGGHPHVTRLTLNRLGRGPTEAIVARLTRGRDLPPDMLGEIAARTDGIPLFVEELTKAVLEAGTAGPRTAVPASLHASLMARLDRVPGVKEVAQVAACVGREFAYPLLRSVAPMREAELRDALDRLAAAELVFARGAPPEASYAFKHALVRDAAHESLLKKQRQRLHGRLADAIERDHPALAEAQPELLAQHCAEAGRLQDASDYWWRAGQRAIARSAAKEAVEHLRQALQTLAALPDDDGRRRRELDILAALGAASIAAHGYAAAETGAAFDRARELCEAGVGDARLLARVFFGQAVFRLVGGQLHRALEGIEGLLLTEAGRNDRVCRIVAHRGAGAALTNLGRNRQAAERLEQALALHDPTQDRDLAFEFGQDLHLTAKCWLTFARFALGQVDQAQALIEGAMREVATLRHFNTQAMVACFVAVLASLLQEPGAAARQAAAMRASAVDHAMPFWVASAEIIHGWAVAALGDAPAGIAESRRGLGALTATGSRFWLPYYHGLLGESLLGGGRAEEALAALEKGLDWAARTGERWYEAELLRRKGEALARLGAADAALEGSLRVAREQGALTWELRAATSLVRLRAERGERAGMDDLLAPLCARFTEGFSTPDFREARALLDGEGGPADPTRSSGQQA